MCEDAFSLPRGTLPFMSGPSPVSVVGAFALILLIVSARLSVWESVRLVRACTITRVRSAVTCSITVSAIIIGYVSL